MCSLTIRADRSLLEYIKERARRNDRSMNREIQAVFRDLQKKEKASDIALGKQSDASDSE
ncbi:Arc family DNA-binding protein [Acetobacter sp. DsW_059]|uniref:Arc family DNA-binding protein n=1 Tax=Acetobacter sp. DsW_059 TaxID=1670661 RepID=UPI000A3694D5|nr:hypothetical protein HK25_01310 [Acetobacter sp. DsW_059]